MLDVPGWLRLIEGLISATKDQRVTWSEQDMTAVTTAMKFVRSGGIMAVRVFTVSVGQVFYELSSSSLGEPYSLVLTEMRDGKAVNLGSCRSSTSIVSPGALDLNAALKDLYDAVDSTIETSDEVVDRLLRGLGEK